MKHQKRSLFCLFCLFLFLTALCTVSADIGPKDQLTVYLTNPPQETYYLDLLWQPDTAGSFSNLSEEELAELDPALLSRLESGAPEGWAPAMVCGTPLPMWGDLVGHPQGDQRVHVFGYVGLPQVCRILLVTESGRQILTDPIERKVLQSSVTLDCASGRLYQSSPAVALGISFLATLLPTLLIEGLLLLLFGFSLRQNWKAFVLANLVTQIALTLIVHTTLLVSGTVSAHMVRFPTELAILVAETIFYRRFLTGQSRGRRTGYGICANLVSWIVGFFSLGTLFELMRSLC